MEVQETLAKVRDAVSVARVYGEPYERDGVTVIPAAMVGGGGGGGSGEGREEGQTGSGAGFGLGGRPVGAYVIADGQVRWEPAVDVTRIATQALLLAGLAVVLYAWRRR